jgi:hypothetical protein
MLAATSLTGMLKCTSLSRATIGSSFTLARVLTDALCSLKDAGGAATENVTLPQNTGARTGIYRRTNPMV